MKQDDGRIVARSASWVLALELLVLIVLIGGGAVLAFQANQAIADQTTRATTQAKATSEANRRLLMALQQGNTNLLNGVKELLDRPVISVKTIRRVVNRKGVRTVVVTRVVTRERIVYRTRTITKIVYVCRLPNGKPCPKSVGG